MSFPDTTESTDTVPYLADWISINANTFEVVNGVLILNYPDEVYEVDKINGALKGISSQNPLDFKWNNVSMQYQDSIQVSMDGSELYITKAGDIESKDLQIQTPYFDLNVIKVGATIEDRYYATFNQTHISGNLIQVMARDFAIAKNADIKLNGAIAYQNDSIIFEDFEVDLAPKTKAVLNGYAIYGDELEFTKLEVSTFQSTLFELQRLFILDEIEEQEDVEISSRLWVAGNMSNLLISGDVSLNNNTLAINTTLAELQNGRIKAQVEATSTKTIPHQFVTSSPKDLILQNIVFHAKTTVDSNFNIQSLVANFNCSEVHYSDYTLTNFSTEASINDELTAVHITANEQNLDVRLQTYSDISNADSIAFTGFLNMDIPTLTNLSEKAGNAHTPVRGYYRSTDTELALGLTLDSLLFISDSLETDLVELVTLRYTSHSSRGITFDFNMNQDDVFWFKGDSQIWEWLSADKLDTSNYPFFEADMHLKLDSTIFNVLVGEQGALNITDLIVKTADSSLLFSLRSPLISYDSFLAENIDLDFSTNFQTHHGFLHMDSLINPYLDLNNLKINLGSTSSNRLESNFYARFTDFNEPVDFTVVYIDSSNEKVIKFKDNQPLQLANQDWVVSKNQGVSFDSLWNIQNAQFTLTQEAQQIAVSSQSEVLDLNISDFQIEELYQIVTGDSLVKGVFNLHSTYGLKVEKLVWDGTLNQIKLDTIQVGNMTTNGIVFPTSFKSREKLVYKNSSLTLDLESDQNQIVEYELDLKNFDIKTIHPVLNQSGFEGNLTGIIEGNVKGKLSEKITAQGQISFIDVVAQLQEYGVYVAIPNSKINIVNEQLELNNFLIRDVEGNDLTLNGVVPVTTNSQIKLHAFTNHFQLLKQENKTKKYWGEVNISSNVNVKGTYSHIGITGYLDLLSSSNIGYRYNSEVNVGRLDDEIDFVSFTDTLTENDSPKIVVLKSRIDWELDMNFSKTKIYVLLSEISNDYVRMTANGKLKFRTGSSMIPQLYGKIESNSGSIFYDAPMVSDLDLKITKALIRFTGDTKNPTVSFSGTETFKVSTSDIPGQSNKKGVLVPVEVIAKVKESPLDEFELKFDLRSDNGEMGSYIDGLPADTREKYAMNLLLSGSMDGVGQDGNSTMQAVVSKLNELSRRNIQSADLAFYLDTEQGLDAGGDQNINTLGYDFSKGFFDDKVNVSVGGEVVLESDVADGRKQFNPLGNVEVNYQIKQDPEIKIFASRKNSYLGAVDGQIDQYAVGISFSKWFKNIFHKKESKKGSSKEDE
jgi:hypothetical protein